MAGLMQSPMLLGNNTIPGVKVPKEIADRIPEILKACRDFGLDFYDTIVEFLTYDEISEVAAYDGFPVRYPHWKFGEQYEELSKGYEHGMQRIYEMVINCTRLSTMVATKRGTICAGDVVEGDNVLVNGETRHVVATVRQPKSRVVRMTTKQGQEVVCTPNHKWLCLTLNGIEWVAAGDLKSGSILVGTDNYSHQGSPAKWEWDMAAVREKTRPNVRHCLTDINAPQEMTTALAEFLGVVIGDGSCGVKGQENSISVPIDKNQPDYVAHVRNLAVGLFGEDTVSVQKHRESVDSVLILSKAAVHFMDCVGFAKGCTYHTKRVPWSIWKSSHEYRAAFLRGLFDTDGYATDVLGMSAFNHDLALDAQLLLAEMGIVSTVSRRKNNDGEISVLMVQGRESLFRFRDRIDFAIKYKSEGLVNLTDKGDCVSGGPPLPYVQKRIMHMSEDIGITSYNESSLGRSVNAMKKEEFGKNALYGFLFRAVASGYHQFGETLSLMQRPMFEVASVEDAGEEETVDIALDHDAHDFLANGLVSHNTNPCYIYCLDSNAIVDHVTVIAHATGHNDFFKNNVHFGKTSQNMMNELANHGSRIRRYMAEWGRDVVGRFIDKVVSIETLIDPAKAWVRRQMKEPLARQRREYHHPRRVKVEHDYMEDWIHPKEYLQSEKDRIHRDELAKSIGAFEHEEKDIFGFIKENAPLLPWQQDIIAMMYDESMYFGPQRQTKTINEGWACTKRDTLVYTDRGVLKVGDIVDNKLDVMVSDGKNLRKVTNWFKFENRETVRIKTNRGYEVEGAANHRLLDKDGEWKRLDEIKVGDRLSLAHGDNLWTTNLVELGWQPVNVLSAKEIAQKAGKTYTEVMYYRYHQQVKDDVDLNRLLAERDEGMAATSMSGHKRKQIHIPSVVDHHLASFLGLMTGDGHISDIKRVVGYTSGDRELVDFYVDLVQELFGITPRVRWDDSSKNGRWRVTCYSRNLRDFLVSLGLSTGVCARIKTIPDCILRSPKSVMASFLQAYFDCDAYAGECGVILSTSSVEMTKMVQTVLLNFGILSNKFEKEKDNWHVTITGRSSQIYRDEIGFNLAVKQKRLNSYVEDRWWFCKEDWTDEVVAVEPMGSQDVYDITVEETHRYVASGFVNHNSFTDSQIMARMGFAEGGGYFDYAVHKAGVLGGKYSLNPYKLGYMLFLWIEDCWNKGKFGPEYDDCEDIRVREAWDKKIGLGHEKVFEVREFYDDVTLISEFFSEEFCRKHDFFEWKKFPTGEYKIASRDFKNIKSKLLQSKLNGGLPDIRLVDPNHKGRRILLLQHNWDGRPLLPQMTKDTMKSLAWLWKGVVYLVSKNKDGQEIMYACEDDKVEIVVPER